MRDSSEEKGAGLCWKQQLGEGVPAWWGGAQAPSTGLFNFLAKADAVAKWQSQTAPPDLLKLLPLHRHGLVSLSYLLRLYTIRFFYFQGLLCARHHA